MAENTVANNVGSSNDDFRKSKNSQRNRKSHFHNNQNDLNQAAEEGKEKEVRRSFQKPHSDWCEHNITQLSYNHTLELPPFDLSQKKFAGRNRLYIANVGEEITCEDLQDLFKPYGDTCEVFINKEKKFAFLKMDYHENALKARKELDGVVVKNRVLRIKISPSCAIIKVKNLVPAITSELLYYAFTPFGEIESAMVIVDERGRSIGEGTVDFIRKNSAIQAIQKCKEKCYFLSYSLKPVVVEPHEIIDQSVGLLDKHFSKRNKDFAQERSVGPRLAELDTFEHEYGTRWKTLFELYKQKEEALRVEFHLERDKLEAQMAYARYEHETESLREQLRIRELDKERQKREWETKERQAEEEKVRSAAHIRQQQEEMQSRLLRQHEDMRRRQESEANLMIQAQTLNSILDNQEQLDCDAPSSSTRDMSMAGFDNPNRGSQNSLLGFRPASEHYERSWGQRPSDMDSRWVRENVRDRGQFLPKRRRY